MNTRDEGPAVMSVDTEKMRLLADRYTEYRHAITTPTDPVKTLSLTGKVLAAVHQIVTDSCTHQHATSQTGDRCD